MSNENRNRGCDFPFENPKHCFGNLYFSSDHPHALGNVARVFRHIELENLEHVDFLRAGRKTGIAEDSAERFTLGDLLDHTFGDIGIKAGNQIAVVVGVDGAAAQLLGLVRQGQRQPPIDQAAEQQVEVGAVILDVGFQLMEKVLIVITGRVINVLHVGGIQLEHAETDVEFGVWRVKSGVVICQLLFQNF